MLPRRGYCDGAERGRQLSAAAACARQEFFRHPPRRYVRDQYRIGSSVKKIADGANSMEFPQPFSRTLKMDGAIASSAQRGTRVSPLTSAPCTRRRLATWVAFAPRRSRRCVYASALRRRVPRGAAFPDPDDDRTPDGKSDPERADAREGLGAPSPGIPRALPTRRDSLARYDALSALPARFASSSRRRRPQAARPWSHRSRVFRRHAGFRRQAHPRRRV